MTRPSPVSPFQMQWVFLRRSLVILGGLLVLGGGIAGLCYAWQSHLVFYYTPQELLTQDPASTHLRLGGRVQRGSLKRHGSTLLFAVTDGGVSISVTFSGILPRLFQEGQGVVAEGIWDAASQCFQANALLIRHDEVYAPQITPPVCQSAQRPPKQTTLLPKNAP